MAAYLIYELSMLAVALSLAARVLRSGAPLSEHLCLTFSFKLLITSVVPFLTTLLSINSPMTYWVIIAAAVVVWAPELFRLKGSSLLNADHPPIGEVLCAAAVLLICTLVGLGKAGPFSETDSLVNFSYVLEWANNRSTPYFMAYFYSSFWELNFIPAVVLHATDGILWWPAAQATFLLGVATYALGLRITRDRYLTWLVVGAVMTLPAFIGVSGYGTLKNDMIYAAGAVLLTYGLTARQSEGSGSSFWLTVSGLCFLSVKYSGPIFAALVIIVWLALGLYQSRKEFGRRIGFVAIAGLSALVLAGHYYLKNIFEFGNPIFPYPVRIGPLDLHGEGGLPSSSLLTRVHDLKLWMEFFHSPVYGLAAPIAILTGLLCALVLCARGLRKRSGPEDQLLLALVCLIGWLIYVSSVFSDWLGPSLVSLRYASGAIAITFICIAATAKLGGRVLQGLAAALLIWCAASQALSVLTISYRYDTNAARLAFLEASIVVVAIALATCVVGARLRLFAIGFSAAACLAAGLYFAEINRGRYWLPEWAPIITHVSGVRGGESVFLLSGAKALQPLPNRLPPEYSALSPVRYPLVGPAFTNDVRSGAIPDLVAELRAGRRFDTIAVVGWTQLDPTFLASVAAQLRPFGYIVADSNEFSARFARSGAG